MTLWTFRGRASRSEFWWWVLGSSLLSALIMTPLSLLGLTGWPVTAPFYLFSSAASLKISLRRFHDVGKGGAAFAMIIGGTAVGMLLYMAGSIAYVSARGLASDGEHLGTYALVSGLGVLISAVFGFWSLVIHCQSGKPERNRFDD